LSKAVDDGLGSAVAVNIAKLPDLLREGMCRGKGVRTQTHAFRLAAFEGFVHDTVYISCPIRMGTIGCGRSLGD
jgi:hypothetical protein